MCPACSAACAAIVVGELSSSGLPVMQNRQHQVDTAVYSAGRRWGFRWQPTAWLPCTCNAVAKSSRVGDNQQQLESAD